MDFFLFTENRIHRVFLCKVIYNFKQNSQPIKTSFFPRKFPIIYQPIASISSTCTLKQANVSMRYFEMYESQHERQISALPNSKNRSLNGILQIPP